MRRWLYRDNLVLFTFIIIMLLPTISNALTDNDPEPQPKHFWVFYGSDGSWQIGFAGYDDYTEIYLGAIDFSVPLDCMTLAGVITAIIILLLIIYWLYYIFQYKKRRQHHKKQNKVKNTSH